MQSIVTLQNFLSLRRLKSSKALNSENNTDPIIIELNDVLAKIQNSRSLFDFETDYDMIDSLIFEEQALLSRYSHLLSIAKQKGLSCSHAQNLSATKAI